MSVKLEKYLNRQRDSLDVESPDDSLIWDSIQHKMHYENPDIKHLNNKIRLLQIRNIAATAIILFTLGYIANDIVNGKVSGRKVTLSSIDSQLGRREMDYRTLVNFKTEEVKTFVSSDDKVIVQLFSEIKDLDAIYDQAMKDLRELGPNEKVINTIFSTYEQKIRLLELIVLETNKKSSHENNEKIIL
jgi:hypothetical protein